MKRWPAFGPATLTVAAALSMAAPGPVETASAQAASTANQSIARIDPCALLTKDEIQHQIELSLPSGRLDRFRSKGVVWSITMQPTPRGESRVCDITWQGTVDGEAQSHGDFSVVVTFAGWLTGSVAGMTHPLPIPNLGDEAYFVGGKSGPPYARVGKIAIGIENFPDTKTSKSGVDLLRAAVSRARTSRR